MINFKKVFFIFVLASFLLWPFWGMAESKPVDLYFFEGQGCSFCARMKSYLEGLKSDFPNLKVYEFEVYFNKENQTFFEKMARAYGAAKNGVPMLFIDNEVIDGANFEKVKNAVERCSSEECVSPMSKIEAINENQNSNINQPTDGQSTDGQTKNETVGWIIIGAMGIAGLLLIIFYFKKKKINV